MQKREKELLKNSLILSIGALVPKLLGVLTVPILTGCLSKDDMGCYDLIVSSILLVIPVVTLQIQQGVFRFLMTAESESERKRIVSGAFLFVLGGTGGIGAVIGAVLAKQGVGTEAALLIVAAMILEAFYMLAGQTVRGQRKTMVYSLGAVVYSCVYVLLLILLVGWAKLQLRGVLTAVCGGYSVAALFMIALAGTYRYFSLRSISIRMLKEMLMFSAPIVPSSISLWVINYIDRMVIVAALGMQMNGIYAVASRVAQIYTAVYGVFTMAWSETAVLALADDDKSEYYSRMLRGVFRATVGMMLILFTVTPLMYRVMIHGQYDEAYIQTLILYFGMFFNSIVSFFSGIYVALKRTKSIGISSVVGAVVNLVINLLLVRRFGLFAASLSTAVSFAVIAVYRGCDLGRKIGMKYDIREMLFGMGIMLTALVLMLNRRHLCTMICLVIAVVYNIKINRSLIMRMLGLLRKKSPET